MNHYFPNHDRKKDAIHFTIHFIAITVLVSLIIIAACGPTPTPEKPYLAKNIRYTELVKMTLYRTIDTEAGVVCYFGYNDKWGQCFLIDDTRLDY